MAGLDVTMLVFLGFLLGVFVGAMGVAFSHDMRMEKRRRAAVAEREQIETRERKALAEGEV